MRRDRGANVVPPNALVKVETRGETSEIDDFMYTNAKNVIAGAAAMYGVGYDITLMGKTASAASSPAMVDRVMQTAEQISYFDKDQISGIVSMGGSEDFSQMMTEVQQRGGQGTYFFVGSELAAGHHDFYFDFDENCLVPGVEFIVSTSLDILT